VVTAPSRRPSESLAEAHGQHRGFAFHGHGLLHGHSVADGAQDLFAAGRVGQGHAVPRGLAQQLRGRLVHAQQVALGVCDDDGLEDGLQNGVRELKLHLAVAGFGFVKITQPGGHAVQFGGDNAKAVVAFPDGSVFHVALGDSAGVTRQLANREQRDRDGAHSCTNCRNRQHPRKRRMACCGQGPMGGNGQPDRQPGEQRAPCNQPLRQVQHPVSYRSNVFILDDMPDGRKAIAARKSPQWDLWDTADGELIVVPRA